MTHRIYKSDLTYEDIAHKVRPQIVQATATYSEADKKKASSILARLYYMRTHREVSSIRPVAAIVEVS